MYNKEDILNYIFTNNPKVKSIFTVESTKINKRFTYRIRLRGTKEYLHSRIDTYSVSILYGPDNSKDYRFCMLLDKMTVINSKGRFGKIEMNTLHYEVTDGMLMLIKFLSIMSGEEPIPDTCKFYKSTRCKLCGGKLTTPESIERGYGPVCKHYIEGGDY